MKKIVFKDITLSCTFQQNHHFDDNECLSGVMSKTNDGFRFEESVSQNKSPKRNLKLFDGKFCSLVHMQNGKYQIHMRTINANSQTDYSALALSVYSELVDAFEFIKT